MHSTTLATSQLFNSLKSQIISLATALYGSTTTPSTTFDVLPFSTPRRTPNGTTLNQYTHGAALIYYTGPEHALHTSWEMLSYVDNQMSVNAGAQQLLDDMQRGVGDVIGGLVKSGQWAVRHKTVPDLAIGEQHGDDAVENGYEEDHGNDNGNGGWVQPLGCIEEGDEENYRGRGR
ncbi:hypothetical protein B5807_08517 [Epicoccum nigrum]|uniref:Uncharacterized protein n=1 Tax=Epicoccum nigrum TaxID=105696 RepID=A0A1Y2LTX8_EPING|nr:hypothetical protein B5807_08517 [Epicoccum nigrum]